MVRCVTRASSPASVGVGALCQVGFNDLAQKVACLGVFGGVGGVWERVSRVVHGFDSRRDASVAAPNIVGMYF